MMNILTSSLIFFLAFGVSESSALPSFELSHRSKIVFKPNQCTTNITLPSATDKCLSVCQPLKQTQLQCEDFSICMCSHAPSTQLRSCFDCIFEGAGSEAMDLIPDFVAEIDQKISAYAQTCEAQRSFVLPSSPSSSLDGRSPTQEERLRFDSCSSALLSLNAQSSPSTSFSFSAPFLFGMECPTALKGIVPLLSVGAAVFFLVALMRLKH